MGLPLLSKVDFLKIPPNFNNLPIFSNIAKLKKNNWTNNDKIQVLFKCIYFLTNV